MFYNYGREYHIEPTSLADFRRALGQTITLPIPDSLIDCPDISEDTLMSKLYLYNFTGTPFTFEVENERLNNTREPDLSYNKDIVDVVRIPPCEYTVVDVDPEIYYIQFRRKLENADGTSTSGYERHQQIGLYGRKVYIKRDRRTGLLNIDVVQVTGPEAAQPTVIFNQSDMEVDIRITKPNDHTERRRPPTGTLKPEFDRGAREIESTTLLPKGIGVLTPPTGRYTVRVKSPWNVNADRRVGSLVVSRDNYIDQARINCVDGDFVCLFEHHSNGVELTKFSFGSILKASDSILTSGCVLI